jgi:hypothetical protein
MTPQKLAKIRALAEDTRGDPAIRAVALQILRRYEKVEEPTFHDVKDDPYRNPPNPRMQNSEDYERYVFMNLHAWRRSAAGNPVHNLTWKRRAYRVTLFKHKKTPTWGWLRVNMNTDEEVWSGRFSTIEEAHKAAWTSLMML